MKRSDASLSTLASTDLNSEITSGQAAVIKSNAALDAMGSIIAGATGGSLASQSPDPQFVDQANQGAAVQATPNAPANPKANPQASRYNLNNMTGYS